MTYQRWLDDLSDDQWRDHIAGRLEYFGPKQKPAAPRFMNATGWILLSCLALWAAVCIYLATNY